MRRGERVVFPGRAEGCCVRRFALLCPPFPALSPAAFFPPAPRGRTIPKRSRRRVPQCPGAPRAGFGAAGHPALLPRSGFSRTRRPQRALCGLRSRREEEVPAPRRHRPARAPPGIPAELRGAGNSGSSGSSGTLCGTPGHVCCAILRGRFAPPNRKCSAALWVPLSQVLWGPLGPFAIGTLGTLLARMHWDALQPLATNILGSFGTP